MKKIFYILFLLVMIIPTLAGQPKGYNITFVLEDQQEKMLFIVGNYGYQYYIVDSALIRKNHTARFQSKDKIIYDGIYQLTDRDGRSYFEFIIDHNRNFTISTRSDYPFRNPKIENSDENKAFFEYQKLKEGVPELSPEYLAGFTETAPSSLLSLYIKTEQSANEAPVADVSNKSDLFFDHIDFSNPSILRMPVNYGVELFFTRLTGPHPDTIIRQIDRFITETVSHTEVRHYFLDYLMRLFDHGDPRYDAVLVHLFDRYCPEQKCEWLDEYSSRRFSRETARKRKLLPGQQVPPLRAFDRDSHPTGTADLGHRYIILWFWDPDCEDCLEQTPILYEFYQANKEVYDIEVYAVSVTEDLERWERFIDENDLQWINVSFANGEPNYDFVDYFDLITTPGIYVIDDRHTIIDRQFPLEKLPFIFD